MEMETKKIHMWTKGPVHEATQLPCSGQHPTRSGLERIEFWVFVFTQLDTVMKLHELWMVQTFVFTDHVES